MDRYTVEPLPGGLHPAYRVTTARGTVAYAMHCYRHNTTRGLGHWALHYRGGFQPVYSGTLHGAVMSMMHKRREV